MKFRQLQFSLPYFVKFWWNFDIQPWKWPYSSCPSKSLRFIEIECPTCQAFRAGLAPNIVVRCGLSNAYHTYLVCVCACVCYKVLQTYIICGPIKCMLYMTSNICRLLTCCVCSSGFIWLPCLPDQDLQAGLNSNPWQAVDVQMHKGYLAVQRAPGHPIIDPTASFGTSTPWHETVSRNGPSIGRDW